MKFAFKLAKAFLKLMVSNAATANTAELRNLLSKNPNRALSKITRQNWAKAFIEEVNLNWELYKDGEILEKMYYAVFKDFFVLLNEEEKENLQGELARKIEEQGLKTEVLSNCYEILWK